MEDVNDERRRKSEDLAERGFDCLRAGDYEAALEIAKELEELRYTAAFDIAAQAYTGLDNLEKAVETLERGVREAPTCWPNWELLGNYSSDMGNYDRAADAYERALTCPGVWEDSIRLNQAILASRYGDHERSLNRLDMVRGSELSLQVAGVRITALKGMGRLDEALSLADECLGKEWEAEDASESLADIAAAHGRIHLEKGSSSDDVRRSTMDAIENFGSSNDLLALIRDIDSCYSTKAQYLRLLIHGSIPEDHPLHHEAKGYFVTYDVVAETPEQALKWVREFEHVNIFPVTLHIEESEVLEERPEDPLGVYWRTGRHYYENEDDE